MLASKAGSCSNSCSLRRWAAAMSSNSLDEYGTDRNCERIKDGWIGSNPMGRREAAADGGTWGCCGPADGDDGRGAAAVAAAAFTPGCT